MKIQNVLFFISVMLLIFTFSCKNCSDIEKENTRLKNEIDSLKNSLAQFNTIVPLLMPPDSIIQNNTISANDFINNYIQTNLIANVAASQQIDTAKAKELTGQFRNSIDFRIPVAWEFDSAQLIALALLGKTVRFYAGVRDDEIASSDSMLTLIAVPVGPDSVDKIIMPTLIPGILFQPLYEFAKPCPPKCSKNNPYLLPAGERIEHFFIRKP